MQIGNFCHNREQRHKQRRGKRAQHVLYPQNIGDFERKTEDPPPSPHKTNGWLWGRIADQAGRSSLEWLPWGMFLSMWKFGAKKNTGQKEQIPTIKDGKLQTVNEFDNISTGQSSLKIGKPPYFSKVPKIREIIYCSAGVCSLKSYRNWHNSLYKAGYAEALVRSSRQRLFTLEELEAAGQFFCWGNASGTPSQENHYSKSDGASLLNHRVAIELLPKIIPLARPLFPFPFWGISPVKSSKTERKNDV